MVQRIKTYECLLVVAILSWSNAAKPLLWSQNTEGTTTLQGVVAGTSGHPVVGAVVTLQQAASPTPQTTKTDERGAFHFMSLVPGEYQVHAEAPSDGSASYGPLVLHGGETRSLNLTLTNDSDKTLPGFFDAPNFVVAGVSETSGAGGHGSDAMRRKTEDLTRATVALGSTPSPNSNRSDLAATSQAEAEQRAEELRQELAKADRADLHHELAMVEERAGQPLDAVHEFERAAEMDPSESNLFDWGTELLAHRAADPAVEVLTRGSQRFPNSVRMLMALAIAQFARGAYEQATDRLCQASDLDPNDPRPYEFLGSLENVRSSPSAAALNRLARFAKLQPENAHANYYYAVALWQRRKLDGNDMGTSDIEALLEKAFRLDPTLAGAQLQIGILHAEQQQWPQTIQAYQRAIQADPNLEEAHYRLSQAYRRTGDKAHADEELRAYRSLAQSADQKADQDRKQVLQFVYELRTTAAEPEKH